MRLLEYLKQMHHSRQGTLTHSWPVLRSRKNPARPLAYRREAQKIRRETLLKVARGSSFVMEGVVVDEMMNSPEGGPDEPDEDSTLVLEVNGDG